MTQLHLERRETLSTPRELTKEAGLYLFSPSDLLHIALYFICSRESGLTLLGRGSELPESFETLLTKKPDLVIIDAVLLANDGARSMEAILTAVRSISRVIVLAEQVDVAFACSVLSCGADGYLLTSAPLEEFVQALRSVAAGRTWLESALTRMLVDKIAGSQIDISCPSRLLSERERQILNCVAKGKTSREIARELYLSESSVRTYWYRVLSKLNALNKAEAITRATRLGLLDPSLGEEEQAVQLVSPRMQALLRQVSQRALQSQSDHRTA